MSNSDPKPLTKFSVYTDPNPDGDVVLGYKGSDLPRELAEIRLDREKGLRVKMERWSPDRKEYWVILDSDLGGYHCIRYFEVATFGWSCSFDEKECELDAVFAWLANLSEPNPD